MERISLLERGFVCCPSCRGDLQKEGTILSCAEQHGPFNSDSNGRLFLIELGSGVAYKEKHEGGINRFKSFLKRWPWLYYAVWYIFCPVLLSGRRPSSVQRLLKPNSVVLNVGSGPRRVANFVNIDVVPFTEVDVIAEAAHLPFRDNSVDALVNESLLEHVEDPNAVVAEMARVLKTGGVFYASVPFLTPYHASPDDFNRWTKSGLRKLFKDFETVEEGVDGGPWSAMLVFMAYGLGVIFSFGSRSLATKLAFVFMIILGPFKIFDYIFARLPGADAVAAQLYFIGKKK